MAPLTRSNVKKYNSKRIKNKVLNDSTKLNKIAKKRTNKNHQNLKKIKENFDIITSLPLECSQKVLLNLSKDNVASAYNCCRNWRNVMSGNYFWKNRCQLDDYHVEDETKRSKFFRKFLQRYDCYWQGLYSYYDTVLNNWKNNDFKKILRRGSTNRAIKLHYFDENILIVTTAKHIIKMMDSSTGNQIKSKLGGHRRPIIKVFKRENYLVSYCFDSYFKIWDLSQDGLCTVSRLVDGDIQRMCVSKNVIAFNCRPNNEIFMYDFKGALIYRLNINVTYICSLSVYDNILAIAAMGGNVKIVEFNSKSSTSRTLSLVNEIYQVEIINGYLLCILYSSKIHVYELKTLTYLHTMESFSLYHQIKCIDEGKKIVSEEEDRHFISIWDIATGQRLVRIRNQYVMKHLISNRRFIVVQVPHKKLIKVWCCKTKQLITQISLEDIGLKNAVIGSVYVTDSKLALMCYNNRNVYTSVKTSVVLLNFENDKNLSIKQN